MTITANGPSYIEGMPLLITSDDPHRGIRPLLLRGNDACVVVMDVILHETRGWIHDDVGID